ncbi:MAG: hypothetical protein OEY77_00060 [Nitrospira sp.]|nr:hypothetical protein [Nitrospira sp.]
MKLRTLISIGSICVLFGALISAVLFALAYDRDAQMRCETIKATYDDTINRYEEKIQQQDRIAEFLQARVALSQDQNRILTRARAQLQAQVKAQAVSKAVSKVDEEVASITELAHEATKAEQRVREQYQDEGIIPGKVRDKWVKVWAGIVGKGK